MCFVASHTGFTDFETSFDKFDVTVLECVVNNPLVLLNRDGASGVAKESKNSR